jgi:hypothetical protein
MLEFWLSILKLPGLGHNAEWMPRTGALKDEIDFFAGSSPSMPERSFGGRGARIKPQAMSGSGDVGMKIKG